MDEPIRVGDALAEIVRPLGLLRRDVHRVRPRAELGTPSAVQHVVRDDLRVVAVDLERHSADALDHVVVDIAVVRPGVEVEPVTVVVERKRTIARALGEADSVRNPVACRHGLDAAVAVARIERTAVIGFEHVVVDAVVRKFVVVASVEHGPPGQVVEKIMADAVAVSLHEHGRRDVVKLADVVDVAVLDCVRLGHAAARDVYYPTAKLEQVAVPQLVVVPPRELDRPLAHVMYAAAAYRYEGALRRVDRLAPGAKLKVLYRDMMRVLKAKYRVDRWNSYKALVGILSLRRDEVHLLLLQVVEPLAEVVQLLAEAAEDVGIARARHVAEIAGEL